MKKIINAIFATFCLLGAMQIHGMDLDGMEPDVTMKTALGLAAKYLNNPTQNNEINQSENYLSQALNYGLGINKKTDGMNLKNVNPTTHTISIVTDRATIANNKVAIVSNLNKLQNKIGEEGLTAIHNALLQQYTIDQQDVFADFEPLAIVFNKTNNTNNKKKLSAIIFAREKIYVEQGVFLNNSQPSLFTMLQNCSIQDKKSCEKFLKSISKEDSQINKCNNTKKDNNTINNKKYFMAAAGISIGFFMLLFIAHRLNLLPTDFFKTTSQYMA